MRDIQRPGRSTVYGTAGAAATSQPLATYAAVELLHKGGNAVDAAIAACAVQCVVEPMGTGIGGDCFALLWRADNQRVIALNGSGRSPAGLSPEFLQGRGLETIGLDSVHSVTVPGAVDAWVRLHADHGKMPWRDVIEPAIRYAEEGFAVGPCTAIEWNAAVKRLGSNPATASQFLAAGAAPQAGDVWTMPMLARSLRAIANAGRAGFYEGPVAADMVESLRAFGGTHTLEDFAATAATYVTPISGRYRDAEIVQMPPNSQGLIALLILNAMKGTDLSAFEPQSAERFHVLAEATRLAFEVKAAGISEDGITPARVDEMLGSTFTRSLQDRIRSPGATEGERDTVYVAVVDKDRNVCSFINSIYMQFGSALTSEKTGVLFHNRGADFVVAPGHPNSVAPRKRPTHTILPALAMRDGRPWLAYGVKGAAYQPIGQAQVISNLLDHSMDLQEAIDDPRCAYDNGAISVERGISEKIRNGLRAFGHDVVDAVLPLGGAQAVAIDWQRGSLAAASDPRKDGVALAY